MVLAPALVVNTNEKATAASVLMSIFFALIIFVFITLIFLIVKLTVSCLVAQMLFVLIDECKGMAVLGDTQKLWRLLTEVMTTPAPICDKSATRWWGCVARGLVISKGYGFLPCKRPKVERAL